MKPTHAFFGILLVATFASSGCSRIEQASAVSQPVEPTVSEGAFPRQKYVLQNNFTLLWKTHAELASDVERVAALVADMAQMGTAGSDLITQKFTVAQALSIQAGVLAQENGLEAKQTQLDAQQAGLEDFNEKIESSQTELNSSLSNLQTLITQLTAQRTTETDPDKRKALDTQIEAAQSDVQTINAVEAKDSALLAQNNAELAQITPGLAQIAAGLQQIAQAKAQITQKLTDASQAIHADRTEKIPPVVDDFSEPTALVLDFDSHGAPTVSLQGWSADGGTPADYESTAGRITNVSYTAEGGVFKFTIPLPGGVAYAFTLSRARYDLASQGIIAFHADMIRSQKGRGDRNGIGKFMGAAAK